MTNSSGTEGREPDGRADADLFPAQGTFNTVVPLSQVGSSLTPSVAKLEEREEDTLVPSRRGRARRAAFTPAAGVTGQSWGVTASALLLSVVAGLGAGGYLVWSLRPSDERPPATVEQASATVHDTEPTTESVAPRTNAAAAPEAKAVDEKEVTVAPKPEPREATAPRAAASEPKPRPDVKAEPRAERPARATASELPETRPAPKPARSQSAAAPRPRVATAEKHTATPARSLPVSEPPPSATSKKVIQWP